MIWALVAACVLASVPAGLRWLRVAQREHYLSGEVTRFANRWWWRTGPLNLTIDLAALAGVIATGADPWFGLAVPIAVVVGPVGLSIKGVTSPLAWTERLRRTAIAAATVLAVLFVVGGLLDEPVIVLVPLLVIYAIVDLALLVLAPYERRRGGEWVDKAAARLESVGPEVVAITGSFGKTTTKNYLAHLLSGDKRVVASPASFNNRMGLARAINENLVDGTEVFIAEMGTYGYGEIADLCEWIPPKVAAMVSIGPVHLERFKTLENIARAKSEILEGAEVGVICVDYPELAALAAKRKDTMRIVEVSAADGIVVAGEKVTDVPDGVFGANLAVALGICAGLGISPDTVLDRLPDLPTAEHRQSVIDSPRGFKILDDTFNSNPSGAMSAVEALGGLSESGRTAVITPGMVELGRVQESENEKFARFAAEQVDDLVIVGRTNRKALLRGSAKKGASVSVVDSREEAVEWVKENLGSGDAVLYENDLPDHYP